MYYVEEIQLNQAESLLAKCGLTMPEAVDVTLGVFRDDGQLLATGSLKGDMIQGIAVDPAAQGEDLTGKLLTSLLQHAKDGEALYLFTKPEKILQFTGLGFRLVAKARPYAALLEWGAQGVNQYKETLQAYRACAGEGAGDIGALVMNCNPFTLGHRYLVEQAAAQCRHVYVLVVEEELSRFSFAERFSLVQQGTADLDNVTVLSGGRYAVSTLTFPSYFTKNEKVADAHAAIDAELFAAVIAPALNITKRYIGTEPLSPVTQIYNDTLKTRLVKHDIAVVELPRKEDRQGPISASRVRQLIDTGGACAWAEIKSLVPPTTFAYLAVEHRKVTLQELLDSREERAAFQQLLLQEEDTALLSLTLNIPGPVKTKTRYCALLQAAVAQLSAELGLEHIRTQKVKNLITGPEGYLLVDSKTFSPETLKRIAVHMEETHPAGRILDIDVMTKAGAVSRSELGLSGRKCLLCQREGKVCAREQTHKMTELLQRIDEILDKVI